MSIVKKITAVNMAAVILAMSLTACGSNDVENMPDEQDVSGITENTAETADTPENAISETPDESLFEPETYEDYIKLADTYLQTDDVIQALAVLDEGIEKLSAGGQGVEEQGVDLLSQRKEYILAGTVAIRTELKENDESAFYPSSISECDENGNKIKSVLYGKEGKISYVTEYQYDENGNEIEYIGTSYDDAGNGTLSTHWTWAYNADGREIEFVSYDADGNIEKRTAHEYDTAGNGIKYEEYDEDGSCTENIVTDYDERGNQIRRTWYDSSGRIKFWFEKEYDESGNEIKYVYYKNAKTISFSYEKEYDQNGNIIKNIHYKDAETLDYWIEYEYDEEDRKSKEINYKDAETIDSWTEYEYDEKDNLAKGVRYNADGKVDSWTEYEYDEKGNEVKRASCDADGTVNHWYEYEYDENGNQIKAVSYDGKDSIEYMYECKYGESGTLIYEKNYEKKGDSIEVSEREYDENGNDIKIIDTRYDGETGQKQHETIDAYAYDENKNITEYTHSVYYEEEGTDSRRWERKYDADGRETDFYLYINEQTPSYQSKTEYDENGWLINYTGCDADGTVLVRKETEYDASGNIIRENDYDADGNLIQYYESEYDDFGNVIRRAMYEGGILKSEQQMSYVYRYIGNIDAEAAVYIDNDITPEEYNLKQREIFTRFLNGQETVRYRGKEDHDNGGKIVSHTITNLFNFAYCREAKEFPEYTFLDVTGDGIEELIIRCGKYQLYVIQNVHGVLKIIFDTAEYESCLVKGNGKTGICTSFYGHMSENVSYDFFDESGKEVISLEKYWDSEGEMSYMSYDNILFEWHSISEGEYSDMTEMMTEIDIDWYQLEEPNK